ncbi:MAG: hypothetical protein Q9212_001887 [Teloschistes hypoglaucus]
MFSHVEIVQKRNACKTEDAQINLPEHDVEMIDTAAEADDYDDESEGESIASEPVIERFKDYKLKIQRLLNDIGMPDYEAEVIQHSYDCQNCVYALNSPRRTEQYILRVAVGVMLGRDNQTIDNELALLNYLTWNLPVPRIKAYSLNVHNPVEGAYSVQTRIPGQALNKLWYHMTQREKYQIIDEMVKLLRHLEAITFPKAGEFVAASPPQETSNDYTTTAPPIVRSIFNESDDLATSPRNLGNLAGLNLKRLLTTLLKNRIHHEKPDDSPPDITLTPRFQALLDMLDDHKTLGAFSAQPFPIVLHHWDLEPRNIIVSRHNTSNTGRSPVS